MATPVTKTFAIGSAASVSAKPDCSDATQSASTACNRYNTTDNYRFDFSGESTTWKCLVPDRCGKPSDHLTVTTAPTIFSNVDVWASAADKKVISVNAIPLGVRKQIDAGNFKQCLPYEQGMPIPTTKSDGTLLSASEMVYVCGKTGTKAYKVKNATTAAFNEPVAFAALSADEQTRIGAYEVTDTITSDLFNPNSGAFSQTWTEKTGGYPLGKLVNIDNTVYKCLKPADCGSKDPSDDTAGTTWQSLPSEQVPPSSVVKEVPYSANDIYYGRDMVILDNKVYRCKAVDVEIDTDNVTNDCNSETPSATASYWKTTGLSVVREGSTVGGPFVADADYETNDIYIDVNVASPKVYRCTPGSKEKEVLCRKPYSATTSGWAIVSGATIPAGNEKILKNITYYQNWFNGLNYIKGDIVRVGFGDKTVDNLWLCNDDLTCSTTAPAVGQTAWSLTKTGYNVDPQNGLSYAKRQNFAF